jgi:hypothetical protein
MGRTRARLRASRARRNMREGASVAEWIKLPVQPQTMQQALCSTTMTSIGVLASGAEEALATSGSGGLPKAG